MADPSPRCLELLAQLAREPSGVLLQHAPELGPFIADGSLAQALALRLARHTGASIEITAKGREALGLPKAEVNWTAEIVVAIIAAALLLGAIGESAGWWNLIRLDEPAARSPGPPSVE